MHGVDPAVPGTLVAQSIGDSISVGPQEGRVVLFGRQADEVHVCVGGDDQWVSKKHGRLEHAQGHWTVRATGRRPIRLPTGELFAGADPVPLTDGYTPLFILGGGNRQHLLEVYVVGSDGQRPTARHDHETMSPPVWPLTDGERLALIVLGQRYLRHEPYPQPLSWSEAAAVLAQLDPHGGWRTKTVEHRVAKVRQRLHRHGVFGLVASELPQPIGNQLNDHLIRELIRSATLVPTDLQRLDEWADG
ncbi:FHA domain-containing protein [Pseudonocardia adelaidensis]|uniref:FHA domain-containing protein n=1 Tax=Pseudonocardia adelaidensis TaxID=648754 RepID=A0ABP9NCJ8_9PSEU